MLQKNPKDKKHIEYHDGEHEYWPARAPSAGKSVSTPAALLNALAAAAAAALLAAALTVMYTQSSPRVITQDYALVNVNIYNNVEDHKTRYSLYRAQDLNTLLQRDSLDEPREALQLHGLAPGTHYVLHYEALTNGQWEHIGDFEFITPGDPVEESKPLPTESTEPGFTTEPADQQETTEAIVEESASTEETTLPQETTEETRPPSGWNPPVKDPDPKPDPIPVPVPDPTVEPTTEPETEPPTEPKPAPESMKPEIGDVIFYEKQDSGDENHGYYTFHQFHVFENIPDGAYEVEIRQNGEPISAYTPAVSGDGTLSIDFTGNQIAVGATSTTSVTVTWADGTQTVSNHTLVVPSMKDVALAVTRNGDNTHTFTVTVTADPGSEYSLAFVTRLSPTDSSEFVSVEMQRTSADTYTGTYTASIPSTGTEETASVYVAAIWDMAEMPADPVVLQNDHAYVNYTP